jgi:hypothetical protein
MHRFELKLLWCEPEVNLEKGSTYPALEIVGKLAALLDLEPAGFFFKSPQRKRAKQKARLISGRFRLLVLRCLEVGADGVCASG